MQSIIIDEGKSKCLITKKIRKETSNENIWHEYYRILLDTYNYPMGNTTVEYSLKIGSSTKRTDVAAFNDCVERQNNILWIIESKQKDDFVKCIELKGVSKKCNNYFFSNQGLAISRVDRWRVSNV